MNPPELRQVERKYLFASYQREVILSWLDHVCLRDPRYPRATVSSIYFDTPSLSLYREKRNGDYLRAKVRLRWYPDNAASDPVSCETCFLEVKLKEGSLSRKSRRELRLPTALLEGDPFSDGTIADLAARLGEMGYSPRGILVPTLLVRYRRHRFLDPFSRARVSVDTEIRCTRANPAFVPGSPPVHLDAGILEVKGGSVDAPRALRGLDGRLDVSSFSKYAACVERLLTEPTRRI